MTLSNDKGSRYGCRTGLSARDDHDGFAGNDAVAGRLVRAPRRLSSQDDAKYRGS